MQLRSVLALAAVATTAATVAIAPGARAASLVPQMEGEINVGLGDAWSDSGYLDLGGFDYSVTSLEMDVERGGNLYKTQSRLFVDKAGTENDYGSGLRFISRDIGTAENAEEEYWFRPVAMNADGTPIEGGQLEAGKFLFDFGKTLDSLSLDFFDVESSGVVGSSAGTWGQITKVNGETVDFTIDSGKDRAISSVNFENVTSLEVMFGNPNNSGDYKNDKEWGTGDGVLLRGEYEAADVPEPGLMLGLLAVGLGGVATRRRTRES